MHILCSSWILGVPIIEQFRKLPVVVSTVDQKHFNHECMYCMEPGACITCSYPRCRVAAHPICVLTPFKYKMEDVSAKVWLKDRLNKVIASIRKHRTPSVGGKPIKTCWPFEESVDASLFPDYYMIIKTPIDLLIIDNKVNEGGYSTLMDFIDDIKLLRSNAYTYNDGEAGFDIRLMADVVTEVAISQCRAIIGEAKVSTNKHLLDRVFGMSSAEYTFFDDKYNWASARGMFDGKAADEINLYVEKNPLPPAPTIEYKLYPCKTNWKMFCKAHRYIVEELDRNVTVTMDTGIDKSFSEESLKEKQKRDQDEADDEITDAVVGRKKRAKANDLSLEVKEVKKSVSFLPLASPDISRDADSLNETEKSMQCDTSQQQHSSIEVSKHSSNCSGSDSIVSSSALGQTQIASSSSSSQSIITVDQETLPTTQNVLGSKARKHESELQKLLIHSSECNSSTTCNVSNCHKMKVLFTFVYLPNNIN